MIKKPITIQISNGLEARPVAMLVQVAASMKAESRWKAEINMSMQKVSWV